MQRELAGLGVGAGAAFVFAQQGGEVVVAQHAAGQAQAVVVAGADHAVVEQAHRPEGPQRPGVVGYVACVGAEAQAIQLEAGRSQRRGVHRRGGEQALLDLDGARVGGVDAALESIAAGEGAADEVRQLAAEGVGVFELGLAGAADGQAVLGAVAVVVEAQVELVAPCEQVMPGLQQIDAAFADLDYLRGRPSGTLRINDDEALSQAVLGGLGLALLPTFIVGKDLQVRQALTCLLANGHLLIEDLPGVGKTTLAHTLARLLGLQFSRIQFTSDMLPADVIGLSIFDRELNDFRFIPGALFSQILLADEINRATPRAQSALLECMEEFRVSVDGVTYELPKTFMVLATQNPIDMAGTHALPEAQLDRFFVRLSVGYPSLDDELSILSAQAQAHPIESLQAVTTEADILAAREAAKGVHLSPDVARYAARIVAATREHADLRLPGRLRAHLPRSAMRVAISSALMPTMASPRFSESFAMRSASV